MSDFVLAVRVTPRSSRAVLEPGRGGALTARVTAPPVDGAANAAVIALVAQTFGVPRRDVRIVAGETAREKRLVIAGEPQALAAIAARLSGAYRSFVNPAQAGINSWARPDGAGSIGHPRAGGDQFWLNVVRLIAFSDY